MTERQNPNILITGTPGTGKSSLAEEVATIMSMNHIDVGSLIKEKMLHDGKDEEFDAYLINEDKVCDELEDTMRMGNNIVDFHSCDFFPERWFDLIVVLRTDNSILYPRLEKRGYSLKKISENIECEIMQVILDEARSSYKEDLVWQLKSDTIQEMEENVHKISQWVQNWKKDSEMND